MACISNSIIHSGTGHQVGAGRQRIFPRGQTTANIMYSPGGVVLCFNAGIREQYEGFSVVETERIGRPS